MASKYSLILMQDQVKEGQKEIENLKSFIKDKSMVKFWKISLGFIIKFLLMLVSLATWFTLLALSNKSGYGLIEYALAVGGLAIWLMFLTYFIKKINKLSFTNECFFHYVVTSTKW